MSDTSNMERLQKTLADSRYRLQAGKDPESVSWQQVVETMLIKAADNLEPGRLVTYSRINREESATYGRLRSSVTVPEAVCALYIPPSAMETMLAEDAGQDAEAESASLPETGSDAGLLLANRCGEYKRVLYAQLARPPHTPGIEIYDDGELLAVYRFHTIEECIAAVSDTLDRFF